MDWREFSANVLAELEPRKLLEERLAFEEHGFKAQDLSRRWEEFGAIHVIAAGKPAAAQASALVELIKNVPAAAARLRRTLAITPQGYGESTLEVEVFHSAHPVPDERSLRAGELVLERLRAIEAGDFAIF